MIAPSGVRLAGFITKGQPTAIAGATLWAMLEHGLALVARHPRHRLRGLDRSGDPGIDRRRIGLSDTEGDLAAIFVSDLEIGIGLPSLVGEVERVDVLQLHHFRS